MLAVMEMEYSGPDRPQENLWGNLALSVSPPPSWLDSSFLVQLKTPLSDIPSSALWSADYCVCLPP